MDVHRQIRPPTVAQIDAEFARRHQLNFMQHAWIRSNSFLVGEHTRIICEKIDEAIEKYKNGISSYFTIKVPFRHGKSDLISRYLPARFIGLFPNDEVMVATYSAELAYTFSRFCKGIMRSPKYKEIFPKVQLKYGQQSVREWGIDGFQGNIHWLGISGGAAGKGASLLIIDDFFADRQEAESEVIRNRVWEGITNDLLTRLSPVAIVIMLATPWHVDDPFGRIQDAMRADPIFLRFKDLKFPARKEIEPGKFKYLFTERFNEQWYLERYAFLGPYGSAGLLDCEPIRRGGVLWRTDKITPDHILDELPTDITYTRGWDLASTEQQRMSEDPDYTAGVKVGVRWIKSQVEGQFIPIVYVADVIEGRWEGLERDQIIRDTAIGDGSITVGVESVAGYKDAATTLQKILFGLRSVKKVVLAGDKVTKWGVLEPAFAAGNVYLKRGPWNARFLKVCSEIPGTKHDDIADGLITAFETHDPYSKHLWKFDAGSDTHVRDYKVNFNVNYIHYGAVFLSRDMRLSCLAAVWNQSERHLYVYGQLIADNQSITKTAEDLFWGMKLDKRICHGIFGNELMFREEKKSISKVMGNELAYRAKQYHQKNIPYVRKPYQYDRLGAIELVNIMWSANEITVHTVCSEAIRQFGAWYVEDGKPVEAGFELCEALALIVSELNRTVSIRAQAYAIDGYKPVTPEGPKITGTNKNSFQKA